jgi:anti-sigma regulatory factor (Ser/Thr protein kinase)/serine/threonine protein phosphatase PrpC
MVKLVEFIEDITEWHQVSTIRRNIANFAHDIGFAIEEIDEISIVVLELAENLLTHKTERSKIICSKVTEGNKVGIQILSLDSGPGISDVKRAMNDGYSDKGTLGIGLGAVKRLSDEFDITSKTRLSQLLGFDGREGLGTVIGARKWLSAGNNSIDTKINEMKFGILSRPFKGEKFNGDTVFLKFFNNKLMIAVIDGLGHGFEAEEAAQKAIECLNNNYHQNLDMIINQMKSDIRKTRGLVISIALIDYRKSLLNYVGIGNVTTRIYKSSESIRPVNVNGMIRATIPNFRILQYPWSNDSIIVMATDGISEKNDPDKYPGLIDKHPMVLAGVLFRDYARLTDDATIVVGGKI